MKPDTVAIYSGGMDSFTLVTDVHYAGRLDSCLSFNYGQRHKKELLYATRHCATLFGVTHHIIDLGSLSPHLLGSALTDQSDMPEGHYSDESMKLTVVPNRNAIMLSIAIAYAVSHKLDRVVFGAHAGDHTIYPDCRPEFAAAMNLVGMLANWHKVEVEAPYLHLTKVGILEIGDHLELDYSQSWTCYKGEEKACGKCGACQERLEAFAKLDWKDPLEYA
jgi:7-cyano-7-deazaguanine synthase